MEVEADKLPDFVVWIQALGPTAVSIVTALIALAVAIVAYRQWKTAREKLVLDLFERRFTLYIAAKVGVDEVVRDGDARNNDGIRNIAVVRSEATFLFGDEVLKYLAGLQASMTKLQLAHTQNEAQDRSQDWSRVIQDEMLKIQDFYDAFPKLAAPYMRMTQKM